MAQAPVLTYSDSGTIDYTPSAATTAGTVVVLGDLIGVTFTDIAANVKGALSIEGIKKVPKTTAAWLVGLPVHWNSTGDPDGGTAGSGAANQLGNGVYMGLATIAAGSGDDYGYVAMNVVSAGGAAERASVTSTADGLTTGLIPAGRDVFVTVTSAGANNQISLPAGTVGDRIRILVGTTGCELISSVAADKVNEVVVGTTNELALTAESLVTCQYTKSGFWIATGVTKLGAAQAALVPDVL